MTFKGALSSALLLVCSGKTEAFTNTRSRPVSFRPPTARRVGMKTTARNYGSLTAEEEILAQTKLQMVGREIDPEQLMSLGESSIITPEGFGFSSPVVRILDVANRSGGYYSAKTSNIVTDVMDEITDGSADVALVFEEGENDKLAGIFTETDYIEVRFDEQLPLVTCYTIRPRIIF